MRRAILKQLKPAWRNRVNLCKDTSRYVQDRGDVLHVDTAGFNGKTWLDFDGHPTTERLHVVERFERHDFGHMSVQVVIDDPGAYTEPWQTIEQLELLPDTDILEFICNENEKSSAHYVGD